MRIALISDHASPLAVLGDVDAGGQNVHVAALAEHLAAVGHHVDVYTRRDDARLEDVVSTAPRVDVHHVRAGPARPVPKDHLFPYMDEFVDQIERSWRSRPPDVVHSHFWMSGHVALQAARAVGVPVVHTFHALGVVKRRHYGRRDPSPPERAGVEQRLVDEADRIVATCTDELFELLRLGGDRARISVVPCGVDLAQFTPDGPVAPRRPDLDRVLVLSRLVERKGIGNVVTALADVPGAELVVAGGPPRSELGTDAEHLRLSALARREGVADRVRFTGQVARRDVPSLLRSAAVVACVPWYEPFGIVPLEAMACGVPVLASAVGGLVDTVVDGANGVHVPPRDPGRIAEELQALLPDASRRRAMGRCGAERARRRYGWPDVARATAGVYRDVAACDERSLSLVGAR